MSLSRMYRKIRHIDHRRTRSSDESASDEEAKSHTPGSLATSAPPTLRLDAPRRGNRPNLRVLRPTPLSKQRSERSEASDATTLVDSSPVHQRTPSGSSPEDGGKVLNFVLPSLPEMPPTITMLSPELTMPTPEFIPAMPSPEPIVTPPSPVLSPQASAPSGPATRELSATLTATWDLVKENPASGSKDPLGNIKLPEFAAKAITIYKDNVDTFKPVVTALVGAVEQTDIGQDVTAHVDLFFEGLSVFMDGLDKIGQLHPFIGVAVTAFKTVYMLEMKRRDNEQKIVALYTEMRSMMGVLMQLQDVQSEEGKKVVETSLGSLVKQTAEDIRKCANACDVYAKKKLVAKVLQGPVWNTKLLGFVKLFNERRERFEYEVTMNINQTVNVMKGTVDVVDKTTKELNAKMDMMAEMFKNMMSMEQRTLAAALGKDTEKLLEDENAFKERVARAGSAGEGHAQKLDLDELREELKTDPDVEIERNRELFNRKFDIQSKQIAELGKVMTRESDRVIEAITGGARERLRDPSIYEIWKAMGWHGNVKARYFVLALRDYYVEKEAERALEAEKKAKTAPGIATVSRSPDPDAWALRFLDVRRVQPILEAFDDDASGFITVAEMNRFTSSRPHDWSLLHWVVYWAVGWKATTVTYARKIETLFAKMAGIRPELKAANRSSFDDYFRTVWTTVHALTAALVGQKLPPAPQEKFAKYIAEEEERLRSGFDTFKYVVDGVDTLQLITGPGRIEKFILPVLYLLMKRHFQFMRIGRTKVISPRELYIGEESILFAMDLMNFRLRELRDIFNQHNLDAGKQFKIFAFGMFQHLDKERNTFWSPEYIRNLRPEIIEYNDSAEDQDIIKTPEDILTHKYRDDLILDIGIYDDFAIERPMVLLDDVPSLVNEIFGFWHGYRYDDDGSKKPGGGTMVTLHLAGVQGKDKLKAVGWGGQGRFKAKGTWEIVDGVLQVQFKINPEGTQWKKATFRGTYDPQTSSLVGGYTTALEAGRIRYKRIQPQYLPFYPDVKWPQGSRARSLWSFAIRSVCQDIRRQRWTWSWFRQRRDDRNEYLKLCIRWAYWGTPLSDDELSRLTLIARRIAPVDACYFNSVIQNRKATTCLHENLNCDSCDGKIGGVRHICLDCVIKSTDAYNFVNLCDGEACVSARITVDDRDDLASGPHEPTHQLLKMRTTVLVRQFGQVHEEARIAMAKTEGFCREMAVRNAIQSKTSLTVPGALSRTSRRKSTVTARTQPATIPACGICNAVLSLPCWYCIKCTDDMYICNSCDAKGAHTEDHHLLRCQVPVEKEESISVIERLSSLESRFADLTNRIDGIETLLHRMAGTSRAITMPVPFT